MGPYSKIMRENDDKRVSSTPASTGQPARNKKVEKQMINRMAVKVRKGARFDATCGGDGSSS